MKTVTLFVCLFGATFAIPLIPSRLASGSASNELLVGLSLGLGAGTGGLVPPLQQVRNLNPFIPPVLELVQQQAQQPQNPGIPQNPFAVRIPFATRFTNPIGFPGQLSFPGPFPQGAQNGQQDPMQSQVPQQNQQQPNQIMPYFISYGIPQYGMPTVREQNMPPFTQFGFIPQQGGFVIPGGQQQPMPNDLLPGGAPVTQIMPAANIVPYFPNEMLNFGNANSGALLMPSQMPTTANALTSSNPEVDPSSQVENKVITILNNEP